MVTLQELDEEPVVLDAGHLHAVERHERLGKNLRGVLLRNLGIDVVHLERDGSILQGQA